MYLTTTKMKIKQGNILSAEEPCILQQCNCLTVRGQGLSKTLADEFAYSNVYGRISKNIAVSQDRAIPGTVDICEGPAGKPIIICLYGQYRPGKVNNSYTYPCYPDSSEDRINYFQQGLKGVLSAFEIAPKITVPYKIGCGLAGGDWTVYEKMIEEFDKERRRSCHVCL